MMVIEKFKTSTKTSDVREFVFSFVGVGYVNKLIAHKENYVVDNVVFIPYQDKVDLIYSLNASGVH